MKRCQTCGTENHDGSQFCDECGTKLNSREREDKKTDIRQPIYEQPVFRSSNATSIGIPIIAETPSEENSSLEEDDQPKKNGVHASLIIERGDSVGKEFALVSEESNIGRWDADNGIFPDVDLDAHDPEAKVSRRHARILYKNNRFMIEDLGSTNGTYVNRGRRLLPGTSHLLNDGDEIIVGKTILRFYTNE